MGPGSKTPPTADQAQLLEAHGIDPSDRLVPPAAKAQAEFVGKIFGRLLHPVLGIDFLPSDNWIMDVNPGPATPTFAKCWPQEGAGLKETNVRFRLAALATLKAVEQP
jgi:hypothetical protein